MDASPTPLPEPASADDQPTHDDGPRSEADDARRRSNQWRQQARAERSFLACAQDAASGGGTSAPDSAVEKCSCSMPLSWIAASQAAQSLP